MTTTVDIRPETQSELARQAAAQGIEIGPYAASLLEEAARLASHSKRLGRQTLESTLQEMAQFSARIPSLPDEVFSREGLYRDHD